MVGQVFLDSRVAYKSLQAALYRGGTLSGIVRGRKKKQTRAELTLFLALAVGPSVGGHQELASSTTVATEGDTVKSNGQCRLALACCLRPRYMLSCVT